MCVYWKIGRRKGNENMVENHPDIRKQEYRGIACLVLSAFCFALMSMFVHLAGDLPSMQKSFFRNLVAALSAVVLLLRGESRFVSAGKICRIF